MSAIATLPTEMVRHDHVASRNAEQIALKVENLEAQYGRGCSACHELTGPEHSTNVCGQCGTVIACADVSFAVRAGRTLGIVGESGSGKTTVLRCLYGDLNPAGGTASLMTYEDGRANLFTASAQVRRRVRNFDMGMVYQHARDGLNLRISAGGNVAERLLAVKRFARPSASSVAAVVSTPGAVSSTNCRMFTAFTLSSEPWSITFRTSPGPMSESVT
ncbi:MAG: ATP-binding cassette domain-containing protein [Proteobacteria bacterium]|nr:ATP-binding cassette domain-containing protein [Pseudomonadota bacterium]